MKKNSLVIFLSVLLIPTSLVWGYLEKNPSKKNEPLLASVDSGPVKFEVTPSHEKIMSGEDYFLLLKFETPKVTTTKSLPLNIAIVIDRSGSMGDKDKLVYAKQAAKEFINRLGNEDRVALVEYDDKVNLLFPSKIIGTDRSALLKTIDLLEPRGATNLAGGLMQGAAQIEKFLDNNRINRVLLLSDGLANTGVADIAGVTRIVENLAKKGIQVTTFGLGADFDEDMLTRVADVSGGNYYFIAKNADIEPLFEKERHALSNVVGKNPEVVLTLAKGLEISDAYGYPIRRQAGKVTLALPDIYSGQNRKVVLRIKSTIKEGANIDVATVALNYLNPQAQQVVKETRTVKATWTSNKEAFAASADKFVLTEIAKAQAADQINQALSKLAGGDKKGAKSIMQQTKGLLQNYYNQNADPTLLRQMKEVDETATEMETTDTDSEGGKLFIKEKKSGNIDAQKEL